MVDHKDGNIKNNRAENLQWITNSQNIIKSKDRQREFPRHIYKHCTGTFIIRIRRDKGVVLDKYAKTLEEAIKIRDDFLTAEA